METFTQKAQRAFEEYRDSLPDPGFLSMMFHCGRQLETPLTNTKPSYRDVVVSYEMIKRTRYADLLQSRCYKDLLRYYCLAKVVDLCYQVDEDTALVFKLGFTL